MLSISQPIYFFQKFELVKQDDQNERYCSNTRKKFYQIYFEIFVYIYIYIQKKLMPVSNQK